MGEMRTTTERPQQGAPLAAPPWDRSTPRTVHQLNSVLAGLTSLKHEAGVLIGHGIFGRAPARGVGGAGLAEPVDTLGGKTRRKNTCDRSCA